MEVCKSPLCVFCLSPPFSIRAFTRPPESSAPRRLSVRSWRRGGSSLPSVRPRFKPFNRRSSNSIPKYLSALLGRGDAKPLTLQEVLGEIQKVWRPSHHSKSSTPLGVMDEKFRKSSSTSNEILSPILLRRRLSAPETIMRKHMLAQQRSESQDSEATQSSETRSCQWRGEMEAGSDSNLNRKRDSDLMRKSTLLRRLWSHSKPLTSTRFSGTFYEWQHSYGKLSSGKSTHSLTSIHSSPEHLVRSQSKRSLNSEFRTSPQHKQALNARKMSPKHQIYDATRHQSNNNVSPKRKISVYNGNLETYTSFSDNTTRTSTSFTPKTDTETYTRYTNTSYTTFSDNSDSAYTNSRSNFSESSNNNTHSEIQKEIIEDTEVSNQDNNIMMEVKNNNVKHATDANESSTQTPKTTNVNVISNVHLSQSTLDLIFNQVMQDVKQSCDITTNLSENSASFTSAQNVESKIINVQQIPSFFLKRKDDVIVDNPQHSRIVKYMISNVGVGSPYSKPAEVPQVVVPRFSALPRTSSMEVNISSGDSTDKESDTVSLVDSLEDTSSLRTDQNITQEVSNNDLSPPLPDNSNNIRKLASKPTAFFIPIEIDDQSGFKSVSEHLPDKVRNRLAKRQQKREEKLQAKSKQSSSRSDSNYISDNGNQIHFIVDNSSDVNLNSTPLPEVNYKSSKKRSKPLLPSIETFRKIKIDKSADKRTKSVKRKPISKDNPAESHKIKQSHWVPKTKNKNEKLSPLYTSKNEYVYDYGPRRIYHKTEFNNSNKRIEILEIMECVDQSEKVPHLSKGKSKIPVLVSHKLPKIHSQKSEKPTFLDLDTVQISDPKLDQLIANILIETLNSPELQQTVEADKSSPQKFTCDKRANGPQSPVKHSPSHKYQQKFEVIPEELSFQSSAEEMQNIDFKNNNDTNKNAGEQNAYKGKAAVAVVRDENFSSIPKGWITFYMLHKNRGSPDSTSDEGKKLDNAHNNTSENANDARKNLDSNIAHDITSSYSKATYDMVKREKYSFDSNENCSSSSEIQAKTALPPPNSNGRYKKFNHQRKARHQSHVETEKIRQIGEWSVTVSGTNSYGQFAPDLEMCVKFPDSQKNHHCPNQSDSGLGEDNEQKTRFPKIGSNLDKYKKVEDESEDSYSRQRLPEIGRGKMAKKQRRSDSSVPSMGNPISSRIEPRQTRTSTRRYNLTRPKIDYHHIPDTPRNTINLFDERHYAEILRRFPEILSITGNAINQEKRQISPKR